MADLRRSRSVRVFVPVSTPVPGDGLHERNVGRPDKDGRERSGRDPIDLGDVFSYLQPDDRLDAPMPPGTKMGPVHLRVAVVDDALWFYQDLVGLEVMGHIRCVGFVSASGYLSPPRSERVGKGTTRDARRRARRASAASRSSFRLS